MPTAKKTKKPTTSKKTTKKAPSKAKSLLAKVTEHRFVKGKLKYYSVVAAVVVVGSALWLVRSVNADSFTWAGTQNPTVSSTSATIPDQPYPSFPGCSASQVKLNYMATPITACVSVGSNVALAVYSDNGYKFAVSKAPFGDFQQLTGIGFSDYYSSPVLVPGTDTAYFAKPNGTAGKFLQVYNSFSSKLTQNGTDPATMTYSWDTTNFDFRLNDENGNGIPVNGTGYSATGEWIVAELKGAGIARVHTTDLTAKVISRQAGTYGAGIDPVMELAVTDNGEHVATGGQNVGLYVYDVPDTCGDPVTTATLSGSTQPNPCPQRSDYLDLVNATITPDSLTWPAYLKFTNAGANLQFFYGNNNQAIRPLVTLTAPNATPSPTPTPTPSPTTSPTTSPTPSPTTDPKTNNGNGPVHALEVLQAMINNGKTAIQNAVNKVLNNTTK